MLSEVETSLTIITATGMRSHYVKVMLDQIFGENWFQK